MKDDELKNILNTINANKPCPFCDTNEWVAENSQGSTDELAVVSVVSDGPVKANDRGVPAFKVSYSHNAYLLSCTKCGFMRLHNKSIIEGRQND